MATTNLRGTLDVSDAIRVGGVSVAAGGDPIIQQTAQGDSTATDVTGLKTDLNALLAKLRLAGVLADS